MYVCWIWFSLLNIKLQVYQQFFIIDLRNFNSTVNMLIRWPSRTSILQLWAIYYALSYQQQRFSWSLNIFQLAMNKHALCHTHLQYFLVWSLLSDKEYWAKWWQFWFNVLPKFLPAQIFISVLWKTQYIRLSKGLWIQVTDFFFWKNEPELVCSFFSIQTSPV